MSDRRRINEAWIHNPRKGEWYVFGRAGSGKDAYVKTLAFAKTRKGLDKKIRGLELRGIPVLREPDGGMGVTEKW